VTNTARWHVASLFDLKGERIGRVRVPAKPLPPQVICWGNRFFTLRVPLGEYGEVTMHLVQIENMYAQEARTEGLPFRKAEK
jgi:hypothetical protein